MSEVLPPGQYIEPRYTGYSSPNVIGEVTEAVHRLLLDTYDLSDQPPRIEEDLKFVPKDREEVIYIYMYRACQNQALMNQKRLRLAPIEIDGEGELAGRVYYHRPPLLMDLFYLVCVHSRFRSDAERLMGWALCTLHYTPKLIYRPRRFVLPDGGGVVDSKGRPYDPTIDTRDEDGLQVEKVSLALVDDLTVGDAINLYTLHEAPYRPFLTYRARVALDGPLYATEGGSTVSMGDDEGLRSTVGSPSQGSPRRERRSGRISAGGAPEKLITPPGPEAHNLRRRFQRPTSETED